MILGVILLAACARERPSTTADSTHAKPMSAEPNATTGEPVGGAVVATDTSHAADSLFEPRLAMVKAGETTCYSLAHWLVLAREKADVGSDVIVRKREATAAPIGASCEFDSLPGDYVVRNAEAEYFDGIREHWLFLESGTGPQSSWVIHDLAARRKIGVLDADAIVGWRDSATLTVWLRADTVPHAKCPDVPEGLVAGSDSLVDYDLRTGKHKSLFKWRCVAWQ
jgi:hypothetical protein